MIPIIPMAPQGRTIVPQTLIAVPTEIINVIADLIDTTLINVNLRNADARNLDVVNGTWTDVDLEGANVGATQFQHLRVMDRVNLKDAIREPDADSW